MLENFKTVTSVRKVDDSPCKNCICLPRCKAENSLLILLRKCSILRGVYGYDDDNGIGDWEYERIGIPDIDTADHNSLRKYLRGE